MMLLDRSEYSRGPCIEVITANGELLLEAARTVCSGVSAYLYVLFIGMNQGIRQKHQW